MAAKIIIVIATLLQIFIATQSEGLMRALVELSAFLMLISLLLEFKPKRQSRVSKVKLHEH
ncbi:hypothetical protein GTG28_12140 [Vibrio sp. OCN044]|uniref:O-succinylbenzoic acid--CoA ligase n=1 Tax=Vibrio tetraodonis subsp. pristinus TaxID=2695891 RepID=A0A6L8LY12_9VIBR|nr:hypothetical protein [Vibrio tetraodonis]MYM59976.1 hypothetical protein [Vibrio tetraodonis subsp. pristinus]